MAGNVEQHPQGGRVALARQLGELARALRTEPNVQDTLDAIVRAAVDTVPGAWHAGISEVERRQRTFRTSAATGDLVYQVDQAQYDTGQGPCLDALCEHRTVLLPDIGTERRWPAFTARAAGLGVCSMLSFQLYVGRDSLGSLNLYASEAYAFTPESEQVGTLFAAHAAVALADARKLAQLSQALGVRDVIGQAKGILMERHKVTGDEAFALLVRASQGLNLKLIDVARYLVETGELVDRHR
ncbi:GAF and ANTAR domain-containing protein [Micromonospora cathayae]|uniref:GAF and ANTAR domain-containing protein n=1 Tax=Micromonospora cathayae TaxID=3028804 RepID=A0ABY7ZTY1_9ACTN|nr:GAF and ANTAR domain-containing protein [Micromonospora sp. HUAS 3]WDZ86511.1 GAF and ANTAR domain-containing protein [Micromonospora sp. HUAS 3]